MEIIQMFINPYQFSDGILPSTKSWGMIRNLHVLCTLDSGVKKTYDLFHDNVAYSAYTQKFASLTMQ